MIVLYLIHVLVCIFLILVVLLQQGKGADLSVFGGGSTQAAFGARGAATLLHKLTVTFFVVFILTTLGIAVFEGRPSTSSVMSQVEQEEQEGTAAATDEEAAEESRQAAPEAAEEDGDSGAADAAPAAEVPDQTPAEDGGDGAASGAESGGSTNP